MNAETNKIKDIYLEILKPVVDKLYHLGVFYSREFARVRSDSYQCLFIFYLYRYLISLLLLYLFKRIRFAEAFPECFLVPLGENSDCNVVNSCVRFFQFLSVPLGFLTRLKFLLHSNVTT